MGSGLGRIRGILGSAVFGILSLAVSVVSGFSRTWPDLVVRLNRDPKP
jgi:hypothetical protein